MRRFIPTAAFLTVLLGACGKGAPNDRPVGDRPSAVRMSSDDQSETQADRNVTQSVRSALAADPSLSARAKALRVTTMDGEVTLEGALTDEAERAAVLKIVKASDAVKKVDDLTTVE